jgi:hypothetical protein
MKMWHCKKQGAGRTGIIEPDGHYFLESGPPSPRLRRGKRVMSDQKTDSFGVGTLLSDAIPVKFHFQFSK